MMTPVGEWSWDGDLALDTVITMASGNTASLSRILTLTNGEAAEWLVDAPVAEDRQTPAPITRETRDRILRIIKDRTGASDAPSTTDEFV